MGGSEDGAVSVTASVTAAAPADHSLTTMVWAFAGPSAPGGSQSKLRAPSVLLTFLSSFLFHLPAGGGSSSSSFSSKGPVQMVLRDQLLKKEEPGAR